MSAFPFISCIPGTSYHGNGHILNKSKERKIELSKMLQEDSVHKSGQKLDRSASVSVSGNVHHVLVCEVKTKSAAKDRGDLVKLGTELKDCLNNLLKKNVDRKPIHVTGILQEGQRSTLFVMNSPFNHFYQMANVYSCTLPSSARDLAHLKETFLLFSYARPLTESVVAHLNNPTSYQAVDTVDKFETFIKCKSPKTHNFYYK